MMIENALEVTRRLEETIVCFNECLVEFYYSEDSLSEEKAQELKELLSVLEMVDKKIKDI